ncbi:MAG TPA: DUF4190 domain-containing protein [Candidatus Avimonas sp.]|jgi:hypothetical protein|nr:DUF4190 domain-containing protein [Clostridiales bacterium]HOB36495.1 DUF4190 domain-containing protein [Candidatus Avimonas sp.]HQA16296.1 DUF4190 domain-containing protein [Candidatus Avimonas sp.]
MDDFENSVNSKTPVENNEAAVQQNNSEQATRDTPAAGQSGWFAQNPAAEQPEQTQPPQYPQNQPQYQQAYGQPPFQNVPPQGSYYPPGVYYPQPAALQRKEPGISIASLVISIVSIVFFWAPFLNILLALIGLILGIVAKVKGGGGMSIAGIVIGALSLVISIVVTVSFIIALIGLPMVYSDEFDNYFNEFQF